MTKKIFAGSLPIGGGAPVSIQSMTNTDTKDVFATLAQIQALADAGCELVRLSIYDKEGAKALRQLTDRSPVPLVADIHFDYRLAVMAMENGVHKLRINPGNIGSEQRIAHVADCAKAHKVPIRIGVNSGSLEKEILQRDGEPTFKGLVDSALHHAKLLEKHHFDQIVLSMKSSNVPMTVAAYRLAARVCDYPLHIGLTEAGLPGQGNIKSAIALGSLLLDGIGDTMRVSLTGSPIPEVQAAMDILKATGLRNQGIELISCPTCGRTCIDVPFIAKQVEEKLADIPLPLKIAVMGCVVNGPGEAREADIGIAGGKNGQGLLFIKGQPPKKVEGDLAKILIDAATALAKERMDQPHGN
ncbi:MAG: flavodoxin-dependent (E)-4-hydroxy-3-methylbut-2-enyl-diphosphate synthase [Clostridiales bacterium]|nr:flavodoxin-dependent (E)-4-hydroxy-3-methylbut-2-enyl-diphosphate synthase [Clostridiales bacterium]